MHKITLECDFFSDQTTTCTYLEIRMDTQGYFDTDKEGNVTKIVNSKYFFFQFGRLGILHVLHRYHQGF